MQLLRFFSIALIALGLNAGQVVADEHAHDHGDAHASASALQLNNGQKWATDDSLRQGMSRILTSFEAESAAISSGKMTPERYQSLAKKIHTEITWLVTNCKLDERTDAMLHVVLAELIDGADAMAGRESGVQPHVGALKVRQALDNYAAYFDHPGWPGVKK